MNDEQAQSLKTNSAPTATPWPTSPALDEMEAQLRSRGINLGRAYKEPDVLAVVGDGLRLKIEDGVVWLALTTYALPIGPSGPKLPSPVPTQEHWFQVQTLRLAEPEEVQRWEAS